MHMNTPPRHDDDNAVIIANTVAWLEKADRPMIKLRVYVYPHAGVKNYVSMMTAHRRQ